MVQSRLISSLLAPALRLWLRSQVESIEALTLDIEGGDRQILSGHIPGVVLEAQQAIYQGLHLSQLAMTASTIRINIGQVIRGKALKLLAPIPVDTTVFLDARGLELSASAPLLMDALTELWQTLGQVAPELVDGANSQGTPTLHCGDGYLDIRLDIQAQNSDKSLATSTHHLSSVTLRTGLTILDGHVLQFSQPHLHSVGDEPRQLSALEGFQIDLGRDVILQTLTLQSEGIRCEGNILVMP